MPLVPKTGRHTMMRDDTSRKKGTVSKVRMIAFTGFERHPLASYRANGGASASSIRVIVMVIRNVFSATSHLPESISDCHVSVCA